MEELDYTAWRFWWDVVQTLILAAIGVYTWLSNRTRVNASRIQSLEHDIDQRLDTQGDRLTRVEEAIRHGPSHEDLKRIHQRMDETNNAVGELVGELKAIRPTLQLIHEYLLNGGKRG